MHTPNLWAIADQCLHQGDSATLLDLTYNAWRYVTEDHYHFSLDTPLQAISTTVFPPKPIRLAPKHMPRRALHSPEGLAAFFHALAHIEFTAIYLAWDIVYRFRNLPAQFYLDWVKIAQEEARHFELINHHLAQFGLQYGDLPAHQGLWQHAQDTTEDILARLALVPRCLEARGLDVTPGMIAQFETRGDTLSVQLLRTILHDEIGHVACGSFWFNTLCAKQQLNPVTHYQDLLQRYYKGGKPKGPFNWALRQQAGFSSAELTWLESN